MESLAAITTNDMAHTVLFRFTLFAEDGTDCTGSEWSMHDMEDIVDELHNHVMDWSDDLADDTIVDVLYTDGYIEINSSGPIPSVIPSLNIVLEDGMKLKAVFEQWQQR